VAVWGGDGTVGKVAREVSCSASADGNQPAVIALDMGTLGVISAEMGLERDPMESNERYIERMRSMFEKNQLKVKLISPGWVESGDKYQQRFMWSAGFGVLTDLSQEVEIGREQGLTGLSRIAWSLYQCLRNRNHLPSFEVGWPNKERTWRVIGGAVVKKDTPSLAHLPLPRTYDSLWMIRELGETRDILAAKLLIDVPCLMVGLVPLAKAVRVQSLGENSEVRISGQFGSILIDSETEKLPDGCNSVAITPNCPNKLPYQIVEAANY
jgi:hypothetical protein